MGKTESGESILSFVDGDPDYFNAIEAFVKDLPKRVEDIQAAFDSQALNELAIKLSSSARKAGESGSDLLSDANDPAREVDKIFREMDSMIQLCLATQLQKSGPQSDETY